VQSLDSQSVLPGPAGNGSRIWWWARRRLRRFVWRHPRIYQPIGLLRGTGNVMARDFEILIDGFPRTSNSFAVAAFSSAQTRPVRVLSHRHTPAFVIAAVAAGKPVCLLIREPRATAVSWSIHSGWDLRRSLESYIDYYESVAPYRAGFCLADFQEVTARFSAVIERINRMFGTDFATKRQTQDYTEACLARTEAVKGWADTSTAEHVVRRSSRPHPAREPLKQELQQKLSCPAYSQLLDRGMRIYMELST
jgi:hypothetical protein